MKKLILFFFAVSVYAESNPYDKINKRNAFNLTTEIAKPILPPVTEILKPNIYLTGITRLNGVRKAHMVLKQAGQADKFISITLLDEQEGIKLKKISKNSALISNNGQDQLISFENNGLPTIITKTSVKKSSTDKGSRDVKKEEKKSAPRPPQPQIVKVPSRNRGITDPRMQSMMERGLEYLNKIEDPKKKEAMLERLEKFQKGDYDKEIKDRMKRYEEYRKRRDSRK
jgi:type II secretory pathway component PulC